jgi:Lon protease-like protein
MLLPDEVPVMTLSGSILFPQAMLPLYIFEPRYRKMLADSLESHRMFAIAMQKPNAPRESPLQIAGLGFVRAGVTLKDGTSRLILQGVCRVKLGRPVKYKPYRIHPIKALETTGSDSVAVDALTAKVLDLVAERFDQGIMPPQFAKAFKKASKKFPVGEMPVAATTEEMVGYLAKVESPDHLADFVSCALLPAPMQRQAILEATNLETRLKFLIHFLIAEIEEQKDSGKK